ncbi:hypothetical protein C8T65DRAFT_648188 [Cerioporus squamosus]|nr:hypothetical protein C8T65DRAFT_648188 [Cerioporus squamosus]
MQSLWRCSVQRPTLTSTPAHGARCAALDVCAANMTISGVVPILLNLTGEARAYVTVRGICVCFHCSSICLVARSLASAWLGSPIVGSQKDGSQHVTLLGMASLERQRCMGSLLLRVTRLIGRCKGNGVQWAEKDGVCCRWPSQQLCLAVHLELLEAHSMNKPGQLPSCTPWRRCRAQTEARTRPRHAPCCDCDGYNPPRGEGCGERSQLWLSGKRLDGIRRSHCGTFMGRASKSSDTSSKARQRPSTHGQHIF